MVTFQFDKDPGLYARMKVIGVGGAGKNAVNHMIAAEVTGVEFLVANTDAQDLAQSNAKYKIQLGRDLTKGLGAGADPEVGRRAAEESREELAEYLTDTNMVFITAGMGGGTGTGAAPVIAEIAREKGVLTVGIVTKPFVYEGRKRAINAENGLSSLKQYVDTLIVIPNQKLREAVSRNTTLEDAFKVSDDVLLYATRGISDLITVPGLINLDFADVRTTMRDKGNALMGTGEASGEDRAREAAQRAIASPLLEDIEITGAEDILMNITGGPDLTLTDVDEAMEMIYEAAGDETSIILGAVIDPKLEGSVRVTVIATGLQSAVSEREELLAARNHILKFRADRPNELETPAFKRLRRIAPGPQEKEAEANEAALNPEDLEVPTYMRRRRNFGT